MINPDISAFLQERMDANDFPSALYLVAVKGEIRFQDAIGYAVVEPERIPAQLDTIYDLASLTKVLVTSLLGAKLVESEQMETDAAFLGYFGPLEAEDKRDVTIRQLATHTSGFKAWLPFYLLVMERSEILGEILQTPVNDDKSVVYSDLNFLALMFVIERLLDETIDEAAKRMIFEPLGLSETYFNPPIDLRHRIAASEKGNEYERQTCVELGFMPSKPRDSRHPDPDFEFRSRMIWGEVHDGNANFMRGVAGHAGLFGTAEDVFKIAMQFLPGYTSLLKPQTCELFTTNFTPGMNEHRSFGFQLASTPDSTAGTLMSPESFGHLGFTGTSLWIDPVKDRVFILLTNRTHNHPLPFTNINSIRRRFHDLSIAALDLK
jgi:CubicO group peptidase (beta-lactamase class C family)